MAVAAASTEARACASSRSMSHEMVNPPVRATSKRATTGVGTVHSESVWRAANSSDSKACVLHSLGRPCCSGFPAVLQTKILPLWCGGCGA